MAASSPLHLLLLPELEFGVLAPIGAEMD